MAKASSEAHGCRRVLEFYSGIGGMVFTSFTEASLFASISYANGLSVCLEVLSDEGPGECRSGGSI